MKKHYIILVLISIIAIAVAIFAYFEYSRTKKDLDLLINSEATNLIESLKYAIKINVRANEYIQKEILNSLVASSALADHLNAHKLLDNNYLIDFANDYDIDIVIIINNKTDIRSNIPTLKFDEIPDEVIEDINFIRNEKYQWLELGLAEIYSETYYLIGGLYNDPNSIIICGINDTKLLDLRLSVGIGTLLKEFSNNEDIEYIILEDEQGIIAATKNFQDYLNIQSFDSSIYIDIIKTNRINVGENSILEATTLIDRDDNDILLRLGISLDKVNIIEKRTFNRTLLMTFGLFVIVAGTAFYAYQRGKHLKLLEEHSQIIEYTGVLLSNINDAVIGIDTQKRIVLYNKKSEEIFGNHKYSYYNQIFSNDEFHLADAFNSLSSIEYNEIEYKKSNETLILAFSTSIIFDKDKKPDITIAIVRDITHIKESEQIRLRNEKLNATSELAAAVAHEIRNPMNAINVIAQRLEFEFEPNDEKDDYYSLISTVRSQIKRIDSIIHQFIRFSILKPPILTRSNLNDIITKSINLLKSIAIKKNIIINSSIDSNIFAYLDNDKFEQVIINLIQNSIDSIDNDGIINVKADTNENKVLIFIEDNGKGISDNIKHKIFDLYFTTKEYGMGLGLGIVNKIILEHNGKLTFESKENSGTTFKIEVNKA